MERIQILISKNHNRAKIRVQGVELDLPISNWNVNGGFGITIPWDVVDVSYNHGYDPDDTSGYRDSYGHFTPVQRATAVYDAAIIQETNEQNNPTDQRL